MSRYCYSIYYSIVPSADTFLLSYLHGKIVRVLGVCANTFPANEGRKITEISCFIFSKHRAENVSDQHLYQVSLEIVWVFKVKAGPFVPCHQNLGDFTAAFRAAE